MDDSVGNLTAFEKSAASKAMWLVCVYETQETFERTELQDPMAIQQQVI